MLHIYLSEVPDWYADLNAKEWDEKNYTATTKKLMSALQSISDYNPGNLLKQIPKDALYEERAILLGKMNPHELALSIYVHKLHLPGLALSYCDRVYEAGLNQQPGKTQGNIYLPLMQVYLNPRKKAKNVEKRITSLVSSPSSGNLKAGWSAVEAKGKGLRRKIAEIEGAEDTRIRAYSSDGGRSDYDTMMLLTKEAPPSCLMRSLMY